MKIDRITWLVVMGETFNRKGGGSPSSSFLFFFPICSPSLLLSPLFLYPSFPLLPQVISKSSEVMEDSATEEKYLIATSEQPLCALHR